MRLTLTTALAQLTAAKAFPFDATTDQKTATLNQGLEAALLSGRFNGTEVPLILGVNDDAELTLPRNFMTAKGVKVNGFVRDLASPWYSYLQGTSDASQWSMNITDRGDNYATFKQPMGTVAGVRQSVPAKLRVVSGSLVAGTVEVHGTDASGDEVWTGSQRGTVLTFGAAKMTPYFSNIREVIKPVTTERAYLYACYDDSTEEVIGIYEPGETVPSYRRYCVNELARTDGVEVDLSTAVVAVLAQRRHVSLVAGNDVLWTSNFRALKNLCLSVYWEDQGDENRSRNHLATALGFLNGELSLMHPPSEQGLPRVNAYACGAIGIKAMR